MSKSEKSAFFRHVFANNFYFVNFSKLFQPIRNKQDTFLDFFQKNFFLGHICTFFEL
jgi:hypothetical protein